MPQRQNLKPALADTLRALRNDVQSGATVPHGVKTVQPGEGLQLLSGGGAEIFWDWETANSVEQRIQDGTALIDQTRATLAQTEQELQSAKDRIGRVAAGEIEKIDGHIILNGTVDLPALNVTGEMAATIVQSMSAETKQLIVTEDAILNRATIVQSLVTPELISQKADIGDLAARMVTSGKLQTSTADNRGVKIDNAGIRAWDDSGRQTVQLNGRSNFITGSFSTAETGQRVRIATRGTTAAADFYAGNNTNDHLGIWYDQTGTNIANSEANVLAMLGSSHTADSPGLKMWPGRGAFTLQGRWWPDSTAMKFALFMLSAGLGAGYYQRVTLNYPSPFPTNNSLRFPFISVETRNGADVIANIVSQTESGVEVNLINKSTDKATGVLYVRVMALNMAS